jgi:SAM-dependent methyltransferase
MLKNIFENLTKRCDKFEHYFPLYEEHFKKYIGKNPRILEIGVRGGGSLQMWKEYFGTGTKVFGVDIDPKCKVHEDVDISIEIGDGSDINFWNSYKHKDFDIIIDDGSHDNPDQIATLKYTYNFLKDGGTYWCEDTHTSYYTNRPDGGYKNPNSFTEYSKNIIDVMSRHHTSYAIGLGEFDGPHVDQNLVKIYKKIQGMHFYDSIVVINKGKPLKFKRVIKK